jgi:endonuclease/exonuclease/phosphatase family metal-dependent hydrolase
MMIRSALPALVLALDAAAPAGAQDDKPASTSIVIDGTFDDWAALPPQLDDTDDAPGSVVDFGKVSCRADGQFVHLLVELGHVVNIQHLDGRGLLLLDLDGDAATGITQFELPGVDAIIELTPPNRREPTRSAMGIGLISTTYQPHPLDPAVRQLSPYDIGMCFAPTHSSDRTEIRMERGRPLPNSPRSFTRDHFTGKLVFLDRTALLRDQTDPFRCALPAMSPRNEVADDQQPIDPLERPIGTTLRVMNWNSEFGALFLMPDLGARLLRAIAPDIILFEEMPDTHSAADLAQFLADALDQPDQWRVVWGEGGGDLRCAVASRFPLRPVEPLRLIPYPDRPDRHVRVAGAAAEIDSMSVLLVAMHLKCCGFDGSREDLERELEVQLVRDAIADAMRDQAFDGVLLAGDLNLVGSTRPLDALLQPLRAGDPPLLVLRPMQLDQRSTITWADPDQPFVPGRLDYMLIDPALFEAVNSFVLDAADLAGRWLTKHGLDKQDTAMASDHLPVVADLRRRP